MIFFESLYGVIGILYLMENLFFFKKKRLNVIFCILKTDNGIKSLDEICDYVYNKLKKKANLLCEYKISSAFKNIRIIVNRIQATFINMINKRMF